MNAMRRMHYGGSHYQFGPGLMTPVVKMLLWVNVGVFVATALSPSLAYVLTGVFGLTPEAVITRFWIWQPVTYMFLHGGMGHVLLNMLVLWMFGAHLERLWGSRFFLRYYFVTGIGAGLSTIAVSLLPVAFAEPTWAAVTIGASGAIYGLLAAFALYFPETPILMFFLFPVPAKYFVMIIGAVAFLSVPRGGGIAHIAHLGGLVIGYLYLQRMRGAAAGRPGGRGIGFGRLGIVADIKYRWVKWKMARLRKRFEVHDGGGRRNWNDYPRSDGSNWDDRIH